MAVDDSSLLPKAPPPRPASRESGIAAALRRFDGNDEPAVAPARQAGTRWAFGGNPRLGGLVTASVLLVVGIPAVLIVLRDADLPPPAEVAAPAPERRAQPQPRVAEVAEPAADQMAPSPIQTPAPPAPRPQPDRLRTLADDTPVGAMAAKSASSGVSTPGAPPAPPPPAPPQPSPAAEADRESAADHAIVVTGGRAARPNLAAERNEAFAQAATGRDYTTFLGRLQAAVRTNDRDAIAGLIAFPLRVNGNGRSRTYRDRRAFLTDYEQVFTPRVRSAILGQPADRLLARDQGVMIGDGAVWFDHVCRNSSCSPPGPVRIRAINL